MKHRTHRICRGMRRMEACRAAVHKCRKGYRMVKQDAECSRAEYSLRLSHAEISNLMEVSPHGLTAMTLEGRITDTNALFEEMTGLSGGEIGGTHFHQYYTSPEDVKSLCRGALEKNVTEGAELELMHRSGEKIPVFCRASVWRDRAGRAMGMLVSTASRREVKEAELKVKECNEMLVHAEKLAVIGELASSIAHEINQPLNHIALTVQLLDRSARRSPHPDQDLITELRVIRDNIMRAADIIVNLREYSRRDNGASMPIDVRESVRCAATLFRRQLSALAIELMITMPDHPLITCASTNRISQVIVNLIANACDALSHRFTWQEKTIDVSATEEDGMIAIRVRDNGTGISPGDLPHIFTPFFTTKEPQKGTGLGLSISKRIIERYGGTIVAESPEGRGTTMKIMLPVLILE